tara:strand:- start:267 stop:557 length:291 start_codon:yes stop_codon:yes gene_type:complete
MAQPKVSYAFEKIVSLAAETNIVDAWNMVIRKAAEIEVDEGNPRELFDTIGIRPFIEQEKKHINVDVVDGAAESPLSHYSVKGSNDRLYVYYPQKD